MPENRNMWEYSRLRVYTGEGGDFSMRFSLAKMQTEKLSRHAFADMHSIKKMSNLQFITSQTALTDSEQD